MTFKSAWHQILQQQSWLTRWRTQQEVLDVSYHDLSEQERASFHKDYPIPKPYLTDLDRFDDTTINNIQNNFQKHKTYANAPSVWIPHRQNQCH
ncbi:MAG: hypothetical protein ABFS56_14880 [Pseudomonadota bacterium]